MERGSFSAGSSTATLSSHIPQEKSPRASGLRMQQLKGACGDWPDGKTQEEQEICILQMIRDIKVKVLLSL